MYLTLFPHRVFSPIHFLEQRNVFGGKIENPGIIPQTIPKIPQPSHQHSLKNFEHLDSNDDGRIDTRDENFQGIQVKEWAQEVRKHAKGALTHFYNSVVTEDNPQIKNTIIAKRVESSMSALQQLETNITEFLPKNRATEIFKTYLSVFDDFKQQKKEETRKNGTLTSSRIHSLPPSLHTIKGKFKSKIISHSQVSKYIQEKNLKDSMGGTFEASRFPNMSILEVQTSGTPKILVFKTGIISITPVSRNGVKTGFTVVDGDGDISQFDIVSGIKYIENTNVKQFQNSNGKNSGESIIQHDEYKTSIYTEKHQNKEQLLKAVNEKLQEKITKYLSEKKEHNIDWEDWNDTVFYEEEGEIKIDTQWSIENDDFLEYDDLTSLGITDPKATAKFLNAHRELFLQQKSTIQNSIHGKKSPSAYGENQNPENTIENKESIKTPQKLETALRKLKGNFYEYRTDITEIIGAEKFYTHGLNIWEDDVNVSKKNIITLTLSNTETGDLNGYRLEVSQNAKGEITATLKNATQKVIKENIPLKSALDYKSLKKYLQ